MPVPAQGQLGSLKRYVVLDSWRGLCACLVVLYHADVNSHIHDSGFVRGCFLCVDFFFVLSGFVITESYRNRLLAGYRVRDFIVLRIARLYPLHAFMLGIFLARELLKSIFTGKLPFSDAAFSLPSLVANVFLVQSLGLFSHLTWNAPSWSISTEFYTYILFAIALLVLRRRLWLAELLVVGVAPFVLARVHTNVDVTYDWGWLRCILGFSAGALCYRVHQCLLVTTPRPGARLMTAVELAMLSLAGVFIWASRSDAVSLYAPLVFSLMVLAFAQEKGAVSRLLLNRSFVVLGTLSYSIYMIHFAIQIGYYSCATALGKLLRFSAFVPYNDNGVELQLIATPQWTGDALVVLMVASIILASAFVHRWVDLPASTWIRSIVRQGGVQRPARLASGRARS